MARKIMNDIISYDELGPEGSAQLHRKNHPAAIHATGVTRWWNHGKIHRAHGPAFTDSSGKMVWIIGGKPVAEMDAAGTITFPISTGP